jgi:hypothetical protein
MDVGGWLRRLGLEQYEATVRENEIDDAVLPSLTAEDLKDLGVGVIGHRRKLLDAIAALRTETSASTPLSDASPATDKAAADSAERRQVTVIGMPYVRGVRRRLPSGSSLQQPASHQEHSLGIKLRATSSAIGTGSMAASSHADCAPWASGTSLPRQSFLR